MNVNLQVVELEQHIYGIMDVGRDVTKDRRTILYIAYIYHIRTVHTRLCGARSGSPLWHAKRNKNKDVISRLPDVILQLPAVIIRLSQKSLFYVATVFSDTGIWPWNRNVNVISRRGARDVCGMRVRIQRSNGVRLVGRGRYSPRYS